MFATEQLFFKARMTLPITGSGSSGILVLYKGASKADLAKQLPLQGGEGFRFDKLAQGVGLSRDHFWIACLGRTPAGADHSGTEAKGHPLLRRRQPAAAYPWR
jgi:hypothetical protein